MRKHSGPKRQSLAAFAVLLSWVPIALVVHYLPQFQWSDLLIALPLLAAMAGFFLAVRIHCPNCGTRLSHRFPFKGAGGILLWAVNEKCPNCGRPLGWK